VELGRQGITQFVAKAFPVNQARVNFQVKLHERCQDFSFIHKHMSSIFQSIRTSFTVAIHIYR
jgi:hypothetical protein